MYSRLLTVFIPLLITLAACAGQDGTVNGAISPPTGGVRVTATQEGKPATYLDKDPRNGRFRMKLTPGSYNIRAAAPGFAQDAIAVNVAQGETAGPDVMLLYASAIDGVDWAAAKIRVTGVGLPPAGVSATIGREMARRAALADVERKLVKAISQIKTGPDQGLKSRYGEKSFTERIQGFVHGYKVTAERELEGGKIEIDAELPLRGPGGLSRYLAE